MKLLSLFLCLFYFSSYALAQQKTYTLADVDEAPFIAECYDPSKDSKECFNQKLSDFLQSNLVTPKSVQGEGKAYATFVITRSGAIKDVQVRATGKDQEKEVIRVLSSLNIVSPARIEEQSVAISHALPVVFKQTIFDSYSAFFRTRAQDLPNATKILYPPLFEECISKNDSSCFQKTLEEKIKSSVQGVKPNTVLNYYLEINELAEAENVLVMSHNGSNASKQAKAVLERIILRAPARNEQKQGIRTYYYGNLVL